MNSEIEKIFELFDCSICLEQLDTSNRVLPCQHTFCKMCLQKIITYAGEVSCPECRLIYKGRIDDLPSNIFLIRILDKYEEMKTIPVAPRSKENSRVFPTEVESSQCLTRENDISMRRINRPILKAIRKLANTNTSTLHQSVRPVLKASRRLSHSNNDLISQ